MGFDLDKIQETFSCSHSQDAKPGVIGKPSPVLSGPAVELQNVWRRLFAALRDRGGDFSTRITLPRLNLSYQLQQRVIEFDVFSWIIHPGSYPAHLYFFCHLHRMLDRRWTFCRRQIFRQNILQTSSLLRGSTRLIYLHDKLKDLSVPSWRNKYPTFGSTGSPGILMSLLYWEKGVRMQTKWLKKKEEKRGTQIIRLCRFVRQILRLKLGLEFRKSVVLQHKP